MSAEVDVYLDVDGVLNAVTGGDLPAAWGWSEESLRCERIMGYWITWSTELVDRINALSDLPHVHFHWLTTWLTQAPMLLAAKIGLRGETWPVLGESHHRSPASYRGWWKLPAAQEAAQSTGRRVVWIDDDLIDTSAREWAATLGDRILLVQPDTYTGVTRDQMGMVEGWVGQAVPS